MAFVVKNFSDIDYAIKEMKYWLDNSDYNRIYSNRGYVLEKSRALMSPCYIHLWMIMHPLSGQDVTIRNNVADLSEWIFQISNRVKDKISVIDVYTRLTGNYLRHVRSELHKNHKYPNLNGQLGEDVSNAMSEIFTLVNADIIVNKRKNNKYQISKERIENIIKEHLNLDI